MTWFLDKAFLEKLDLRGYDPAAIAKHLGLPRDLVAAFVDPARRYLVKSSDYGWFAGKNGDDQPTLVFVGSPRLSGADDDDLLHAVSFDLRTGTVTAQAIACEEELLDDEDAILDVVGEDLGFEHVGSAPVLAFKHPDLWHYAVVPFPFHLHDDAVGASSDDLDAVRAWIEEGSFVLHCGNAYYMSAEGDVTSS